MHVWLLCSLVLANDEAQTPRLGRPNAIVFSNPLRVIGVVCSAWLGLCLFRRCSPFGLLSAY